MWEKREQSSEMEECLNWRRITRGNRTSRRPWLKGGLKKTRCTRKPREFLISTLRRTLTWPILMTRRALNLK